MCRAEALFVQVVSDRFGEYPNEYAVGMTRERSAYALAAFGLLWVEIFVARFVHDAFVRPYGGDTIAVMLAYAAFRALFGLRTIPAVGAAFLLAVAIEFGQYGHLIYRLGLEHDAIARFMLGTGYDPRDFIAYAAGALCVLVFERCRTPGSGVR